MKLSGYPRLEGDSIVIPFSSGQIRDLSEVLLRLNELDLSKEYTLEMKQIRTKRSLDANAYFWVLLRDLATKLDISYKELYRFYIKDYGVYNIVPIKEEAVERWVQGWEKNGSGWVCESIGKSKFDGYVNMKCYFGSSMYDSKEMARLIDAVVSDCKENGVETLPPREIERLKKEWSNG